MRPESMPTRRTSLDDFESLAAAHLDSAYNLARWLVRDPALADDVVQDAMLRALKYFGGFRGDNARAWLLQIVRNVAFTRLKGDAAAASTSLDDARAELEAPIHDSREEPEATLMREDDERLVRTLLGRLPLELRECLILRELEELSYKEIARVVDALIGTVMSRLWRARKLLAEAAGAEVAAS
jgi:RNA polymerase sigma-70 factor (ECF subfamily)